MTLETDDPIAPLQSATIRAVLGIIVTNVASTLTQLGISATYVQEFDAYANTTVSIIANVATLYFAFNAYRGRVNATQVIQKGK